MDMFKGLSWAVMIFVFYIFVFYAFFRIIYRKFKESDFRSKIKIQKSDEKIIKSRDKFQKSIKKYSNQKI